MKVSLFAFSVLFACVCTVAQADSAEFLKVGDSASDLKDTFSGLASALGGKVSIDVESIYNCGFALVVDDLVGGIKDLITEASSCDPTKASDIQAKLQALFAKIPQSIGACLGMNPDAQALLGGLGVLGKSPQQIQNAVTSWITNNPLTACFDLQNLASSIASGNMKQFGADGGAIIIQIFSSKKMLTASKDHFTTVLSGIASTITDKVDVSAITDCGDEPTFAALETALLQVLDEASGCDLTKIDDLTQKITAAVKALPASAQQCLSQSSEGQKLLRGLGILGNTPDQIKTKISSYVLTHVFSICGTLDGLNKQFKGGDYNNFGKTVGKLALDVFKNSKSNKKVVEEAILDLRLSSSKDHFTTVLSGIASAITEKVDVNAIINCGDEPSSAALETALLQILDKAAKCDITKMDELTQQVIATIQAIPASAQQCVKQSSEAQKLLRGLGILGLTPDQIKNKITSYVLTHVLSICGTVGNLNKQFKGGDYINFGKTVGKLALDVFKNSKSNKKAVKEAVFALTLSKNGLKALDNFADLLGGVASVTAKSTDTKTTAKCTDESTAANIINTIADITKQGSTCDLSKAKEFVAKAKTLIDSIPASHKQCFNNDPAAKSIATALGISGASMDKIVQKVLVYTIAHFNDVCNSIKVLNSDVTSGNWNQYGADSGKLLMRMLA